MAVGLTIATILPLVKGLPASTDTEESVTAEIAALQSKLDDILYLNYFKEMKDAFLHTDLWGNNGEGALKDDVIRFHDIPKDKYVTSITACSGTTDTNASFVKGIQAKVDDIELNTIGDLTDATGSDCLTWVFADGTGDISSNFKIHYSKERINSIRYFQGGDLVSTVGSTDELPTEKVAYLINF